jgi:hypothetical protein
MQYRECTYISVLEEYTGPWKPGHILHIMHIMHILICRSTNNIYVCTTAWVGQCQSAMIYERREQAQVLYVIPVSSILGPVPLVPVGATGTIPFAMRRESADFPGASCYRSANSGDGCRWWYVNSWALGWGTKQ